jgi:hypothetical protein
MKKPLLMISTVVALSVSHAQASAPSGRYTVKAGTVLDTKTGLTWQQTASNLTYAQSTASQFACTGGWRVPTIKELQSLVDYAQPGTPKIDTAYFPGTQSNYYWSSTPRAGTSEGWYVDFDNGSAFTQVNSLGGYVRCVRLTTP